MPLKCCVPGCNSNYDGTEESVTVYRFPDATREPERLLLWKRKIPRENLEVTQNSRVCIKHFAERFLIRTFDFIGKNGERELRPYPKLTDDAYPTIFPNLSAHLSSSVPSVRKNPDQRRQAREQRDSDCLKEYLDTDCISRFDILQANITAKVAEYDSNNVWQVVLRDKVIYVHTFDCSSEYFLAVATSFAVREDMSVSLFCKGRECTNELKGLFNTTMLLERWSQ
jgi:hypothetical protein